MLRDEANRNAEMVLRQRLRLLHQTINSELGLLRQHDEV